MQCFANFFRFSCTVLQCFVTIWNVLQFFWNILKLFWNILPISLNVFLQFHLCSVPGTTWPAFQTLPCSPQPTNAWVKNNKKKTNARVKLSKNNCVSKKLSKNKCLCENYLKRYQNWYPINDALSLTNRGCDKKKTIEKRPKWPKCRCRCRRWLGFSLQWPGPFCPFFGPLWQHIGVTLLFAHPEGARQRLSRVHQGFSPHC